MKVICNIDRTRYNHKPQGYEAGAVQNRLTQPEEIDLAELAEILVTGGSIRVSACNGRGKNDFMLGQLIGIDTDNTVIVNKVKVLAENPWRPEQIRQILTDNGIKTALQYYTWSNATSDVPKFRTLIALDKPVSDIDEYRALIEYVYTLFPDDYACDTHCNDVARIFYGSNAGTTIYKDCDAANSTDELLLRCGEIKRTPHINRIKAQHSTRTGTGKTANTANGEVIDAIKNQDAQKLRELMGNPKLQEVDNQGELFNAMYSLDMAEILGVDEGVNFNCILPDHIDKRPSATVYQDAKTRHWLYTCFSHPDGQITYNIKQLVEAIGHFKSEYQSIMFICDAFNIKQIETAWSREQINNIDLIVRCLNRRHGEDAFSAFCPTAAITTRHALSTYIHVLSIARDSISPQKNANEDIIFSASVRQIARACGKDIKKVHNYLKVLEYHNLLLPVEEDNIPRRMLEKAIENAYVTEDGKRTYHTSFYKIPSWVVEQTKIVEDQGKKWKENGYKMKGISYEMFYRTEPDEAKRLYPQSNKYKTIKGEIVDRKPSWKSDVKVEELEVFITDEVEGKGYVTEKQIISHFKKRWGEYVTSTQLAKSLTETMQKYNYKRVRCNKLLKEQYHIEGSGYPFIIIKAG